MGIVATRVGFKSDDEQLKDTVKFGDTTYVKACEKLADLEDEIFRMQRNGIDVYPLERKMDAFKDALDDLCDCNRRLAAIYRHRVDELAGVYYDD